MIVTLFAHLFSVIIDLLSLLSRSDREKDLEIVLLRQQIRILQRARLPFTASVLVGKTPPGASGGQAGQRTANPSCSAQPKSAPVHA